MWIVAIMFGKNNFVLGIAVKIPQWSKAKRGIVTNLPVGSQVARPEGKHPKNMTKTFQL